MSATIALAVGFVRTWVSVYTLGLPPRLRDARRLEIDCDLWEQRQLAEYNREPTLGTAIEMLVRTLLGAFSDITWRVEAGSSARRNRSNNMNDSLTMRGLLALAFLVALAPAGFAISVLAGGGDLSSSERLIFGVIWMTMTALMVTGLAISSSRPRLGIGLVTLGAIGISVGMFWIAFVTVPIGVALVYLAYRRARGTGWPNRAGAA